MTDCCQYKCEQGWNCPVRKKRIKATNKNFIERERVADTDPYTDTIGNIKELFFVLFVTAVLTLLAFILWGK